MATVVATTSILGFSKHRLTVENGR